LAAGVALALVAAALVLKSFLGAAAAAGAPAAPLATPRQWRLGAALAALLVAYVLLLPLLGYIIAVSALVLAVALLAGARQRMPLALCAALSGVALWAVFEWALKIRMPLGRLFS
jgi:cell division protein FtsW (lipid II flippase)